MQTQIRRRVLRRQIWVYTVCQCAFYEMCKGNWAAFRSASYSRAFWPGRAALVTKYRDPGRDVRYHFALLNAGLDTLQGRQLSFCYLLSEIGSILFRKDYVYRKIKKSYLSCPPWKNGWKSTKCIHGNISQKDYSQLNALLVLKRRPVKRKRICFPAYGNPFSKGLF